MKNSFFSTSAGIKVPVSALLEAHEKQTSPAADERPGFQGYVGNSGDWEFWFPLSATAGISIYHKGEYLGYLTYAEVNPIIYEGYNPQLFFIYKTFGRSAQKLLEFTQVSYSNNVNPMPKLRKLASGKEISVYFSYKPIVWSTIGGDMVNVILQKEVAWLYCYSQATGFFHLQNKNPRFRFEEPLFLGGDCLSVDKLGQWIGHNRNYLEHVHGGSFTHQHLELFEEGWMDGDIEFKPQLQLWVSSFTRRTKEIKHNLRVVSNQRQILAYDFHRQEELQETRNKAWSQYSPLPDRGNILEKYFSRIKSYEIRDGIFIPSYK